jgi:hypothetical protein
MVTIDASVQGRPSLIIPVPTSLTVSEQAIEVVAIWNSGASSAVMAEVRPTCNGGQKLWVTTPEGWVVPQKLYGLEVVHQTYLVSDEEVK